jgi:pimeloyl-ACP methyl ester carboxylesterase
VTQITTPTLLMWGERAALFPRDDQDRLLAARGARLKVYQPTGYRPNWEQPEQVAADLTIFGSGRHRGLRHRCSP